MCMSCVGAIVVVVEQSRQGLLLRTPCRSLGCSTIPTKPTAAAGCSTVPDGSTHLPSPDTRSTGQVLGQPEHCAVEGCAFRVLHDGIPNHSLLPDILLLHPAGVSSRGGCHMHAWRLQQGYASERHACSAATLVAGISPWRVQAAVLCTGTLTRCSPRPACRRLHATYHIRHTHAQHRQPDVQPMRQPGQPAMPDLGQAVPASQSPLLQPSCRCVPCRTSCVQCMQAHVPGP